MEERIKYDIEKRAERSDADESKPKSQRLNGGFQQVRRRVAMG
jgi:hypothetical protein